MIDYIQMISFLIYLSIYFSIESKNKVKIISKDKLNKYDKYKEQKYYENTYLYHIPKSRIYEEVNNNMN